MKRKILNVGCGNEKYGTHFVDLYPTRSEVIKCNVDTEKLPFPSNFFDEVYTKNLFEHLTNPGFALSEMVRVLKKGGKIILITDNANYWYWSLQNKAHSGGYKNEHINFPEDRHYTLFTPEHLRNFFEKYRVSIKSVTLIEEDTLPKNIIKKIVFKFINNVLKLTPLKRMAYVRIKIVGIK